MPGPLLPPRLAPVRTGIMFDSYAQLHILSWNACGVTTPAKVAALRAYVGRHHPDVVFIQEAFVGHPPGGGAAPSLSSYIPYVHRVRNGLLAYVHSTVQHRLLGTSDDGDTTYQLLEIALGSGTLRLCNVYSAPGKLNTAALPTPTTRGMIYMGDFNARHPALGDLSDTVNRSGTRLVDFIHQNHLTRWNTGGATHSRGGTLDHILTHGLVPTNVKCFSVPVLFSDHLALGLRYSVPVMSSPAYRRTRVSIPPKYSPNYVSFVSAHLHEFNVESPEKLYNSLVTCTHNFFDRYVRRPNIKRQTRVQPWMLNDRVLAAERQTEADGLAYQRSPNPDTLRQYQESSSALVAIQQCAHTDAWNELTNSINHQTSVGSMWRLINKVARKKTPSALHHSPSHYAQALIEAWSAQSSVCNLPAHVRQSLSTHSIHRTLRLSAALLETDEEDDVPITKAELSRALASSRSTAPGDDGITYSVLRLLLKVPGDPLLRLYNLCLRYGYVPQAWTTSLIIPIPKPGSDKFRPISLTSCFSKVLERILLTRLMFRLHDKLSTRLYGFLPQRSTHHCLLELYTRLSPTSIVAFLDLKSAFDIANKDIILDQLVDFGIKGNLLRWVRGYLSNRSSRVLFKGAISATRRFDLGTPQGGVLSPFLFNVLMHRLLSLLPDVPGTQVTCYADDICIHSTSSEDLQHFLHSFYEHSSSCGLIISPEKCRIFSPRKPRTLPAFLVGTSVIPYCTQYIYLGAPVRVTPSTPVRQRVHPLVKEVLSRLQQRLTPLQWLTNNAAGVSIPVARNIYVAFIRSVVDYLSPAVCQLPRSALDPLDKFQNKAMRLILGCPISTRVANMLQELRLSPLVERIYANVTYFTVKCLQTPQIAPHYSNVIGTSLDPTAPRPRLLPGGYALVRAICTNMQRVGFHIRRQEIVHSPPPWRIPLPAVTYTPTCKSDLPLLQKQLALETIAKVTSSLPAAHIIYSDGSLQPDGSGGCAVYSPSMVPPHGGWVGRRLPGFLSSTSCELHGLLDAVNLLLRISGNGLIICDSQSALRALSSQKSEARSLVTRILCQLATALEHSLVVHFLWVPSHVGITANDTVDLLAKTACGQPLPAADASPGSLSFYRRKIRAAAHLPIVRRRNIERPLSVTIQHYDHFVNSPYKYRRRGHFVRRHNAVSARLRLGYRPVWQVSETGDVPQFSSCKLCDLPNANSLQHYCLECPAVAGLIPHRGSVIDVCKYLLIDDHLDALLLRHPHFGGC